MSARRVFSRFLLPCFLGALVLGPGAAEAGPIFVKFGDIKGESTDRDHKEWTVVDDVVFRVRYVPASVRGGGGHPEFDDLEWSQGMDKTVPSLFGDLVAGDPLPTVTIDFTDSFGDAGLRTYFQMKFTQALLTGLEISAGSEERARVDGAFAYSVIEMEYTEYDPNGAKRGSVKAKFDLEKGESPAALLGVFSLGSQGPGTPIPAVPEPALWPPVLLALGWLGRQRRGRRPGREDARPAA